MAHAPEQIEYFVCTDCQTVHAGTPIHDSAGEHSFEAPDRCGACSEREFVRTEEWVHYHD